MERHYILERLAAMALCDTDSTGPAIETMARGLERLGADSAAMEAFGVE